MVTAHAMSREAASAFADTWIRDWNARDLDAILSHYTDDIEFRSPKAAVIAGQPMLRGKAALAAYWRAALERIADLHFTLDHILWDAENAELVIVYTAALNGQRTRACEFFRFGASGLVVAGEAMYGAALT
jgi:ketosteroid isomerase-like protein